MGQKSGIRTLALVDPKNAESSTEWLRIRAHLAFQLQLQAYIATRVEDFTKDFPTESDKQNTKYNQAVFHNAA
jgi:hypothetical protein